MMRRLREYLEWEIRELREDKVLRLGPVLVMSTESLSKQLLEVMRVERRAAAGLPVDRPPRGPKRTRHLRSV